MTETLTTSREQAVPAKTALEVKNLTGPAGSPVIVDVNLCVPHGGTHLVIGPIHSGKSMLMRHLVGLEQAESGTISLDGESFDARGASDEVLRRMRTKIGCIFEGSALLTRISVLENVELPLLEHSETEADDVRDTARELLAQVGVEIDDDTEPGQLSRAARRRVALARSLALNPVVVLLDEPTVGLDSHAAAEFDDTLARLQKERGFGVLMFSHELRHAYGRTQQVHVMSEGRIVESGHRSALQGSSHAVVRRLLDRRSSR